MKCLLRFQSPQIGASLQTFSAPPFQLSSAFPYVGEALFFPCPVWRIWQDADVSRRKEIKKVKWISEALLQKVLNGEQLGMNQAETAASMAYLPEEPGITKSLSTGRAWEMTERQRVSVDRFTLPEGGQTFFFALQFFAPDAGLYFLADGPEAELDRLESVLRFLGDTGLGADRNSGLGHFWLRESRHYVPVAPERASGEYLLSLYNPDPSEDIPGLASSTAYRLLTRSGWIYSSTVGRPPIRVFGEGSYFSQGPKGRVVHMLNQQTIDRYSLPIGHTAPRDFRAFTLPCAKPAHLEEA